jgi:hypothetical protein
VGQKKPGIFYQGGAMDKRINRFKLCDFRFHPYLKTVIDRLPEQVKETVLNDVSFQILTDDDICGAPVLRYGFSEPVRTLIYLNTKILMEPAHRIIHTIAFEIANYFRNQEKVHGRDGEPDGLLIEWGFEKEVEAVRDGRKIAASEGYRIGYDWARKQNHDYLMQHFGLYFNQWNEKGLSGLPGKELNKLKRGEDRTRPVLDDILSLKEAGSADADNGEISQSPATRKAMLAGILTAVKETGFCKGNLNA